ncbi:hypothetical protein [Nocardia sp. NBC_00511]|uniref:hypothetical protein n=1 Tax=Nocardia sp. NBC_00511 TaxID=2903591 RepID=UPI0030E3F70D
MLVKVRNDDPSRLSSTERTVVNWLKSWSGPHAVPGIAIVQCQDADVVVWTPQTCVVVGVHGFTERVTGTLNCAQDEPWTVDGKPAPIDGDADPLERVRRQTVDLAGQLRSAPGREHVPVSGLVLLVPQLGSRVKLEKGSLPAGIDVLIGDGPSSLRSYFTTIAEGAAPSWDAAQVGQALGALGFAAAATYSDLVTEGFPVPESARNSPLPMSAAPTVVVPSVPVPAAAPPPEQTAAGSGPGEHPVAHQESHDTGRKTGIAAMAGATSAAAAAAAYRSVTAPDEAKQESGRGNPPSPTPQPASWPGQQQPPGGQPQPVAARQGGQPQPQPQPAGFRPGGQPPGGQPQRPQQPDPRTAPLPVGYAGATGPDPRQAASASQPGPGFPLWSERQSGGRPGRAARNPRRRRDLPIIGGLIMLAIILVVAIACTSHSTRTPSKPGTVQQQTSSVATPSASRTTDPTIAPTTVAPACFPLMPCN